VTATGCPPIDTYSFDLGPFTIAGSPGIPGSPVAYAPRRTTLDNILVQAANDAGAEIREGFIVEELTGENGRVTGIQGRDRGGRTVTETARVVVGADGRHSLVARQVRPEQYHERPEIQAGYYTFFSGVPATVAEFYDRPPRGFAAWPTNDGLTLVAVLWPYSEFEANRRDIKGNMFAALEMAPELAQRVRAGRQEERIVGGAVPNYFRKPFGPGWALVGDAGYNKDFITAQGIQDAFRDAELCAAALDSAFTGRLPYDAAMAGYQSHRDERVLPIFEFTCEQASLEPVPPEVEQLFVEIHGNQPAMDHFARVFAGAASPDEFFSQVPEPVR
jgi:flavin-dependent dehydrogenase